jgi:predicted DNA-binding protein (MmcQ/YjbR family)
MRFEALYDHCASLPHATVSVQWGDHNVFKVGGKMFAVVTQDLDLGFRLSIKADPDEFDALCGEHGVRPAPYMARNLWVQIVADTSVGPDRLRELVSRSRELVFEKLPPRQQQALTTGAPASARPKAPRKGPARGATAKRKAASQAATTAKRPAASKAAAAPKRRASKVAATSKRPAASKAAAAKRPAASKVATKRPAAKRPAVKKAATSKRPAASKAAAAKRPAVKKAAKRSEPGRAASAAKGAARARRGA